MKNACLCDHRDSKQYYKIHVPWFMVGSVTSFLSIQGIYSKLLDTLVWGILPFPLVPSLVLMTGKGVFLV